MKLSQGDKTIGISGYAEHSDKPLSITIERQEDRPHEAETMTVGGAFMDKEMRKREQERIREAMSRPRPFRPVVTIGLGLDRETTRIPEEDFDALIAAFDRVRDEMRQQDVKVERYNREQKAKRDQG